MKSFAIRICDLVGFPFVLVASLLMLVVRRLGVEKLPACKKALLLVGVFPIRRHYYEPLFDTARMAKALEGERCLPGVDLRVEGQLAFLATLDFSAELLTLPLESQIPRTFYYHNSRFGPGDAELLYCMIRHFKPRHIVEIGSGFSTLLARKALEQNQRNDPDYACEHVCIEPYEESWLEQCGATVIRQRVEGIDMTIFSRLRENDMLFIDSSHIIRPRGDVLCEYLQILPILKPGVLIHVHDVFTPKDYPAAWVCDEVRFWNEQYLLEAFLCHNRSFAVVCALNYLKHRHPAEVSVKFPVLGNEMWREPGSFWIERV